MKILHFSDTHLVFQAFDRVNAEVNKVIAMPETQARLSAIGAELTAMTPEAFKVFHDAENKRYSELIQRKGIKLD